MMYVLATRTRFGADRRSSFARRTTTPRSIEWAARAIFDVGNTTAIHDAVTTRRPRSAGSRHRDLGQWRRRRRPAAGRLDSARIDPGLGDGRGCWRAGKNYSWKDFRRSTTEDRPSASTSTITTNLALTVTRPSTYDRDSRLPASTRSSVRPTTRPKYLGGWPLFSLSPPLPFCNTLQCYLDFKILSVCNH